MKKKASKKKEQLLMKKLTVFGGDLKMLST